jgi:hypothetical protein
MREQRGKEAVKLVTEAAPASVHDFVEQRRGRQNNWFVPHDGKILERRRQQMLGLEIGQKIQCGRRLGCCPLCCRLYTVKIGLYIHNLECMRIEEIRQCIHLQRWRWWYAITMSH